MAKTGYLILLHNMNRKSLFFKKGPKQLMNHIIFKKAKAIIS